MLLGAGNGSSHQLHRHLQGGHLGARHGDDHGGLSRRLHSTGPEKVGFHAKYGTMSSKRGEGQAWQGMIYFTKLFES